MTWPFSNDCDTSTPPSCGSGLRANCGKPAAAYARRSSRRDGTAADLAAALRGAGTDSPLVHRARAALHQGRYEEAHAALAVHFSTRSPRFPLVPVRLRELSGQVATAFPHAAARAVARADRMLQGRHDVLGYHDIDFGTPPDWHRDPVHGRDAPRVSGRVFPISIPASAITRSSGRSTVTSTGSALGRAYWLTRRSALLRRLRRSSSRTGWLRNPPLDGVNWASMLELAFRSLSWIWALHFFAAGGGRRRPASHAVGRRSAARSRSAADAHRAATCRTTSARTRTCRARRSRSTSPASHSRSSPRAKARAALGRRVLVEEAARQVNADGGHAELSAHYHRYSTDFYLLATVVARRCGDEATRRIRSIALDDRRSSCAPSQTTTAVCRNWATTMAGSCSRSAAGRRPTAPTHSAARQRSWTIHLSRLERRPKSRSGSAASASSLTLA